ncbi:hypothetical protein ACFWPH_17795 [Nocardia sp. NPDC058499]|uniref:hypothetical protein n=1 Tax=Nocardia sp. NPDC058499 TaxID=3346530 RepID=UPI00365EC2C4
MIEYKDLDGIGSLGQDHDIVLGRMPEIVEMVGETVEPHGHCCRIGGPADNHLVAFGDRQLTQPLPNARWFRFRCLEGSIRGREDVLQGL